MTEDTFEAIILGGGTSARMQFEEKMPKQLLPVHNQKSMLQYQIEWLKRFHIKDIVMAIDMASYNYILDNVPYLLKMANASVETEKLGTGGALKKAIELVKGNIVYVMNVDDFIVSDVYVPSDLIDSLASGFNISILTSRGRFPYGIIRSRGSRVTRFDQKPLMDYKVSAGHYAIRTKAIRDYFPDIGDFETSLMAELASKKEVTFMDLDGKWITANTYKEFKIAKREIEAYEIRMRYGTDARGFKGYGRNFYS